MLKKVQRYQCSDGTLVDSLEEVKVKERNFYVAQITQLIKDDKLEIKAIILAMVADKILKDHEKIYALAKEFKDSMAMIEEDLQLHPAPAFHQTSSISAPVARPKEAPAQTQVPPPSFLSTGSLNIKKEAEKESMNATHKDLKPIAANPLGLSVMDELNAADKLGKVDIELG